MIKTLQLNNQSSMWQKDVKGLRCQCQICCQLSGLDCDVRCAQVDGELQLKKKKRKTRMDISDKETQSITLKADQDMASGKLYRCCIILKEGNIKMH